MRDHDNSCNQAFALKTPASRILSEFAISQKWKS